MTAQITDHLWQLPGEKDELPTFVQSRTLSHFHRSSVSEHPRPRLMLVIPSITSYFTFLEELCVRLGCLGWATHLVTNASHITELGCYHRGVEAMLHPVTIPRGGNLLGLIKAGFMMRREAAAIKPDLIHIHFSPTIFAAAAGRLPTVAPTIGTVHGVNSAQSKGLFRWIMLLAERWAFRRMSRLYVLNESDERYAKEKGLAKNVLTHRSCGLGCRIERFDPACVSENEREELRKSLGVDAQSFVFIFIGRRVAFKGFGAAVRAFFQFYDQHPTARLLLVGVRDPLHPTGLTPGEEETLAHHKGIIDVGWREDVHRYLGISHVNLFPSEREGMPVNVMESLAMGVPVITIDSRGCRDIVRHNIDGVVLQEVRWVKDLSSEMLEREMRGLYLDKAKWEQFRCNALHRRTFFDRNIWIAEQLRIYEAIMAEKLRKNNFR